jgi:hypothetical protein
MLWLKKGWFHNDGDTDGYKISLLSLSEDECHDARRSLCMDVLLADRTALISRLLMVFYLH